MGAWDTDSSERKLNRKLAAIFYTDVAGYSRLTGEDEEGTHRRLSDYLDLIADRIVRNHGRVVHYAVLLSALGHLGREDEAGRILKQLRQYRPGFSIDFVRSTHLFADDNDIQHYLEGLRKANIT